jgi:hypothetical protein
LQKEQLLQQKSSELSNQMLQHTQIVDNMRHCEADGELKELLQQELKQAKVTYSVLNNVLIASVTQHCVSLLESKSTALQSQG